jgi:hypothetical protein
MSPLTITLIGGPICCDRAFDQVSGAGLFGIML